MDRNDEANEIQRRRVDESGVGALGKRDTICRGQGNDNDRKVSERVTYRGKCEGGLNSRRVDLPSLRSKDPPLSLPPRLLCLPVSLTSHLGNYDREELLESFLIRIEARLQRLQPGGFSLLRSHPKLKF